MKKIKFMDTLRSSVKLIAILLGLSVLGLITLIVFNVYSSSKESKNVEKGLLNTASKEISQKTGQVVSLDPGFKSVSIVNELAYFPDIGKAYTVNDIVYDNKPVSWVKSKNNGFNFGAGDSQYWYNAKIKNNTSRAAEFIFEVPFPPLDMMNLYIKRTDGGVSSFISSKKEYLFHRHFVNSIYLDAEEVVEVYYQIVTTDFHWFSFSVHTPASFIVKDEKFVIMNAIYFGVMMIMFLYNSSIYLLTRDKSYLYYIAFIASTASLLLIVKGFAAQYIEFGSNFIDGRNPTFMFLSIITGLLFAREVLNIKEKLPKYYSFINVFILITGLSTFLIYVLPSVWLVYIGVTTIFLMALIVMSMLYILISKGDKDALIYALSWIFFLSTIMIFIASIFSLLPFNFFTENIVLIGHISEVSLLSLLLASRINQLKIREVEAIAESKTQRDFLARMSHEIRTPMNGILGMSQLMAETKQSDTQKHYNNVILSSGNYLLKIINDILDFSQISSGKIKLEALPFNIYDLTQKLSAMFAKTASEKKIELVFFIDNDIQPVVIGDAVRLEQVLINLIANAIKFTEEGHVLVTLKSNKKVSVIDFIIEDTGIGISIDEKQRLFDSFVQADSSIHRKYGGTGLGLTISKQLVDLMGGHISIDSEIDKGSTFSFSAELINDTSVSGSNTLDDSNFNVYILTKSKLLIKSYQRLMVGLELNYTIFNELDAYLESIESLDTKEKEKIIFVIDFEGGNEGAMFLSQLLSKISKRDKLLCMTYPQHLGLYEQKLYGYSFLIGLKPWNTPSLLKKLTYITSKDFLVSSELNPETPKKETKALHVIIVDDDLTSRMVFSGFLASLGHGATLLKSTSELLSFLESQNSADLILVACEMPDLNGWEMTKQIRQTQGVYQNIPIIGLATHSEEDIGNRCLASGMDDYILKPALAKHLKDKLFPYTKI